VFNWKLSNDISDLEIYFPMYGEKLKMITNHYMLKWLKCIRNTR